MPPSPANPIGIAAGIAQTVTGLVNNAKTKREGKEIQRTRPRYGISELAGEELDFAESEVGGLSARAENAYNAINNKQFSSSLDAILKGGGSVNNVAEIFGANDEGRQRLALLSDQMRLGQIDRLTRARERMMGEQDKAFLYNEDAPWKDRARANAEARKQAQQDIWGGIKTVAGLGMQQAATSYNQNQYDQSFSNGFGSFDNGGSATGRTTYYTDKPSADYGEFISEFPG